jgi:hypothetical protein
MLKPPSDFSRDRLLHDQTKTTGGLKMKGSKLSVKQKDLLSRRAMLKTSTAAAFGATLAPSAIALPPHKPVDYGTGSGQTLLKPETVFPLLAAWLLLTTNGPSQSVNLDIISCVANLHPNSAMKIKQVYDNDPNKFKPVRDAFGALAKAFAMNAPPYSGGQCPDHVDTIAPVAALLGTPTKIVCGS